MPSFARPSTLALLFLLAPRMVPSQAPTQVSAPTAQRNAARGTSPTHAQLLAAATDTANWLYATHDYSGARYAAIRQITPANASRLAPVCAFQMGDVSTFQTARL